MSDEDDSIFTHLMEERMAYFQLTARNTFHINLTEREFLKKKAPFGMVAENALRDIGLEPHVDKILIQPQNIAHPGESAVIVKFTIKMGMFKNYYVSGTRTGAVAEQQMAALVSTFAKKNKKVSLRGTFMVRQFLLHGDLLTSTLTVSNIPLAGKCPQRTSDYIDKQGKNVKHYTVRLDNEQTLLAKVDEYVGLIFAV